MVDALVGGYELIDVDSVQLHDVADVILRESQLACLVVVGVYQGDQLAGLALDDDALLNHEHVVQTVLNLFGIDVLAVGAEEHVLLAALDVQVAIGVDDTIVARVIPSVSVERLGSSLRVLEIAQHGVGATREYLAGNVRRVAAVYANLHACHLAAARAGMTLLVEEHGDERSALGGSVGLGQRNVDGK